MDNPTVICVGGFSGSSRNRKASTPGFVSEALEGCTHKTHEYSCWQVRRAYNRIVTTQGPILVVAKSLGAIRLFRKMSRESLGDDLLYQDLSVVLIDPHFGWTKKLDYPERWEGIKNFQIKCCYQRTKRPRGACFKDDHYNMRLFKTDHFGIASMASIAGRVVARYINEEFHRLRRCI